MNVLQDIEKTWCIHLKFKVNPDIAIFVRP